MSILTSTNSGLFKAVEEWCKFHFKDGNIKYRVECSKNELHIVLSPTIQNGLIILRGEDLPCKVYFEGMPSVFFTFFDDHSIKYIPSCFTRFCDNYIFLNCTFSEYSIDFINKYISKFNDTNLLFFSKEAYKKFLNTQSKDEKQVSFKYYLIKNNISAYIFPRVSEKDTKDVVLQVVSPADMYNKLYNYAGELIKPHDEKILPIKQMIACGLYEQTIYASTKNFT